MTTLLNQMSDKSDISKPAKISPQVVSDLTNRVSPEIGKRKTST